MSATIPCPICPRRSWLTPDGLAHHLEADHSPRIVAETLAQLVTTPAPIADDVEDLLAPPTPVEPGECATRKRRYETEREARVELVGTIVSRNSGRTRRHETRVYSCPLCGGWHLTSLTEPPEGITA